MKKYSIITHNNPYSHYGLDRSYIKADRVSQKDNMSSKHLIFLRAVEDFIAQDGYPCVGAQAAINSKTYAIGIFDRMNVWRTPYELSYGLFEYLNHSQDRPSNFLTYIAIFPQDEFKDERNFENALWQLLSKINSLDCKLFPWDSKVSDDPSNKEFSYSFGGKAFFLVGMHPLSSRRARRFPYPAIAFNLHSQFENLRTKGRYNLMKNITRQNDTSFDGTVNPMLSDFGEGLEAPQYSGRRVESGWKCPFHPNKNL